MNITIKLKSSYRTKDFLFSVSQSPNTLNLTWSNDNNINIQNMGQYYCFAKSKRTGKISTIATVANCNQTDVNCDITVLPPYVLPIQSDCQLITLPPYSLPIQLDCQLITLPPYILHIQSDCQLTTLPPYTL